MKIEGDETKKRWNIIAFYKNDEDLDYKKKFSLTLKINWKHSQHG
jgi:hypothetical protein